MRHVPWPLVLAIPLSAACRLNFDPVPEVIDPPDAAPDAAPPPVLSCTPPQFSVAGTVTGFAAAATAKDYYAFAIDDTGKVHGFSYGFTSDQLTARAVDVPVFSGAAAMAGTAAIGMDDGVMAVVVYSQPGVVMTALGTALVPLDTGLGATGTPQMHPDWFVLDGSIARSADGTLAFLGAQSTSDVTVKRVTPTGTDVGSPHLVIDRSEAAHAAMITATSSGYLVTWAGPSTPEANLHTAILDKQLGVTSGPTINPTATIGGNEPHAAYVPSVDRYLFAWWLKTGMDEVWFSLRDGSLHEIAAARLSSHGKAPRIVAGSDDFLVVWQDDGMSGLAAARVTFEGTFALLQVDGNGGKVAGWDVVSRGGQPALIWLESGATPTMWLNPLCR